MTITRFAPSPTGLLHLGNLRTALLSYLAARSAGGQFLLRIEDTDSQRSSAAHSEQLQADLRSLGLHWDLGPGNDSELGPFYQSQRSAVYQGMLDQLRDRSLVYPCFCSESQLKLTRKLQLGRGEAPRYDGTCAHLAPAEVEARLAAGKQPAWRLRVDPGLVLEFDDLVRGAQRFHGRDLGDFILQKSDGSPSFMFANAVDDALMGVTHVLRGEDHLSNTPRQLYILRLLELPAPQYVHISLIVAAGGSPLSKRDASRPLQDLIAAGYLPQALLNYLARLGATLASNDLLDLPGLAQAFSWQALGKSAARFDQAQLNYWQKQAVLALKPEQLLQWLAPNLAAAPDLARAQALARLLQANVVFPQEFAEWLHAVENPQELPEEAWVDLHQLGAAGVGYLLELLESGVEDYSKLLSAMRAHCEVRARVLFKSLRWLFSGHGSGPELPELFSALGSELLTLRVSHYARQLQEQQHG